jgi:anti-sigma factor RsiW
MNHELELKLQAYLDGELSDREARRVADWIAGDKEAQALLAEFRTTRSFLAGNEPVVEVPESREFYWSKIQREILRAEQAEATAAASTGVRSWWLAWRRLLAPSAAVAAVALLTLAGLKFLPSQGSDDFRHLAEVENLSEDTGSFSFRSQSENMFVVWIYNKDQAETAEAESELIDDAVIQ